MVTYEHVPKIVANSQLFKSLGGGAVEQVMGHPV